jgi:hypothetical protein
MSLTLSQMASRVLRNCQIPEDSSAAGVQALADAKQYLNERARDVWKQRAWPEYLILGSVSIAAGAQTFSLSNITVQSGFEVAGSGYSGTFYGIVSLRDSSTPLMPEDPNAIQKIQADLWDSTASPTLYINRGKNGLFLLGQFAATTTLKVFGKSNFQDLTDSETWLLDNENCLIAGATGDMIRDHDRDDNRSAIRYQEYEAELFKMVNERESQFARITRVIPPNPWTRGLTGGVDNSKIGFLY